jgi:anaerobic magnesium-protoporphyrin IX monomethyl ester cyclase
MRIFISNPPFIPSFNRQVRWAAKTSGGLHPPIYLAYAAASLKQAGFDVRLEDAVAEGRTHQGFLDDNKKFNPYLIVMETSTASIMNDSRLAEMIKGERNTPLVLTGSHASAMPERTLRESKADMVCIGEYDQTLPEIARAIQAKKPLKGIKGLAFKQGKGIIVNEKRPLIQDLDSLPWPLRDQLPTRAYSDTLLTTPFTFVVTARGCPYQCNYCNWPSTMFGRRIRKRDPRKIVDEVEHCIRKYQLKSYKFFDDTFTYDKSHVRAVCQELLDRGITTPWICNARVDTLDEDTMRLMKRAGCYLFKIGVESGNQDILDWTKKGTKLSQVRSFFRLMKRVGIQAFASFMIGYPQETRETIEQTFRLAKEIRPDMCQFVILQPLPGTELWGGAQYQGVHNHKP